MTDRVSEHKKLYLSRDHLLMTPELQNRFAWLTRTMTPKELELMGTGKLELESNANTGKTLIANINALVDKAFNNRSEYEDENE